MRDRPVAVLSSSSRVPAGSRTRPHHGRGAPARQEISRIFNPLGRLRVGHPSPAPFFMKGATIWRRASEQKN